MKLRRKTNAAWHTLKAHRASKMPLLAGVASIEHGVYLNDELIDLMLKKQVYLVPTLVAPLAVAEYAREHPDIMPP